MGNFRAKKFIVLAADVVSRSKWYIALHQRYTLRFNLVGCLKVYMPSAEVHQTYIAVCMSASNVHADLVWQNQYNIETW